MQSRQRRGTQDSHIEHHTVIIDILHIRTDAPPIHLPQKCRKLAKICCTTYFQHNRLYKTKKTYTHKYRNNVQFYPPHEKYTAKSGKKAEKQAVNLGISGIYSIFAPCFRKDTKIPAIDSPKNDCVERLHGSGRMRA